MAKMKKPSLNAMNAIAEIKSILGTVLGLSPSSMTPIATLTSGKLYELCVLARLLSQLVARGWFPTFTGSRIELKGSPGFISSNDPHFELRRRPGGPVEAEIHVDIQVGLWVPTFGR